MRDAVNRLSASKLAHASAIRILALAAGVLTSVLLARLGGTEVKGTASAYAAANALAYTIIAFDFPQQTLRHARAHRNLSLILASAPPSWPYFGTLAALLSIGAWAALDAAPLWMFLGTITLLISTQLGLGTNGTSGPKATAVGALLQQIGLGVVVAIVYLTVGLDSTTARLAVAGSYLIPTPYFVHRMRRDAGMAPPKALRPREFVIVACRGLRWQPARIAQLLLLRLDTLVVAGALGTSQAGIYSVGLATAGLIGIIPSQFAANTTYRATKSPDARTEISHVLGDLGRALIAGLVALIGLAFVGYWLIPSMYGSDFAPAYQVQLWASPGIVAYAGLQILTNHTRLTGRALHIAIPSAIGVGVMAAVLYMAVEQGSLAWAAAASSTGAVTALLASLFYGRTLVRTSR